MGAYESMGRMLALAPPPSVVVFTMHDEPGMVQRFLRRRRLLRQERRDGQARAGREGPQVHARAGRDARRNRARRIRAGGRHRGGGKMPLDARP